MKISIIMGCEAFVEKCGGIPDRLDRGYRGRFHCEMRDFPRCPRP